MLRFVGDLALPTGEEIAGGLKSAGMYGPIKLEDQEHVASQHAIVMNIPIGDS